MRFILTPAPHDPKDGSPEEFHAFLAANFPEGARVTIETEDRTMFFHAEVTKIEGADR